jgi:hypothetical protein
MEKTGTRKFIAMTTMEMVLIMLVLSTVAYADNSFVPANHPHLLSSDPSYPLSLFHLSLPQPPRRLSLPARDDFMNPGSGASKIPGVGKVIGKIPGISKIPGVVKPTWENWQIVL